MGEGAVGGVPAQDPTARVGTLTTEELPAPYSLVGLSDQLPAPPEVDPRERGPTESGGVSAQRTAGLHTVPRVATCPL